MMHAPREPVAPPAKATLRGQGGFTLARMVVTISVLGILIAAAAPQLTTYTRIYPVRGAARQIYADLQNARMTAITVNHRVHLSVVDSTHYKVHVDANNDGVEDAGEVSTYPLLAANEAVTITASGPVTFAPNGTAPDNATFTASSSYAGNSLNVAVSPGGRIRIQ